MQFCCLETLLRVFICSSFARTENNPKADFSVHIISEFIQTTLWKCISNVFWLYSFETIVSPVDSVDSSVKGFDFGLKKLFLLSTIAICFFPLAHLAWSVNIERPLDDDSASCFSVIFVLRQPSLKCRITQPSIY